MSAADYFRDVADVVWRLERTYLYIGRQLWYVEEVRGGANSSPAEHAVLYLYQVDTERRATASIRDIPVRALFEAPRGYLKYGNEVYWGARGPVRDRHQGLRTYSMWYLLLGKPQPFQGSFDIASEYVRGLAGCKNYLVRKNWGWISRDVLLYQGEAFFQGRRIGQTPSRMQVVITETEPTDFLVKALTKVGCDVR